MQEESHVATGLTRTHVFTALLASLVVSFLLYGNSIRGEFVLDDGFVTERPELRMLSYVPKLLTESYLPKNPTIGVYRPFAMVSFVLNYVLFGPGPVSFHVVNIILNGIVVFLIYLLMYQLFGSTFLALATGIIFAVLPIHTEAVASIKSRDELLSLFFILLGWLIFLAAVRPPKVNTKGLLGSSVFVLAAILSKELAIVAPILYILVWRLRHRGTTFSTLKKVLIYLPMLIGYAGLRFAVLGRYAFVTASTPFAINPLVTASLATRIWTPFKLTSLYVLKTFLPISFSATYHYNHVKLVSTPWSSWEAVLGVLVIGSLLFFVTSKRFRAAPVGVGSLVFLVSYLPISKFIFVSRDLFAERWMYFPSLGLALILAQILFHIYKRKKYIGVATLTLIVLLYGVRTIERNRVWRTPLSLHTSMIRDAPESVHGYTNMARYYYSRGAYDQAKPYILAGMEIYDAHPPLLNAYAFQKIREGDYDAAKTAVLQSLEKQPDTEAFFLYAMVLTKQGKYKESIDIVNRFLQSNIRTLDVRFLMAVNYYRLGDPTSAQDYFDWSTSLTEEEKMKMIEAY